MGPQVCDGNAVAEQALALIGQPQLGVGQIQGVVEELTAMAMQSVGRHHIRIGVGGEKIPDLALEGIGHPGFIHIHHHAVG